LNSSDSSECVFGFSPELDLTDDFSELSIISGLLVSEPTGASIIARYASIVEEQVEGRKEMS